MKKRLILLLLPLLTLNLFAGLRDDYRHTLQKLTAKGSAVSTEKQLIEFKKTVKKTYLSLIEKYKSDMSDEDKILAARMYNDISSPSKAILMLKKVKVNKKNENYYYCTLGQTYFLLNKFKKAIASFKKINYSQPRVALDFANVGFGLIKQGRYKLAESVFKDIVNSKVNNLNVRYFAYLGLMESFELQNRVKQGEEYFKRLLKKITDRNEKILADNVESQLELIGKEAPKISNIVLSFNKKDIKLSQNKGKYTVVFFFSGRSKGSIMALPYIDGIYKKYRNRLEFIGINLFPQKVDRKKQEKFFTWFITQNKKIKYPVAIVGNDKTYRDYRVYTLPHFAIINPAGKIDKIFIGFPNENFNPLLSYLKKIGGKKK